MSVLEVVHWASHENGVPKAGGLMDLKMGTTEREFNCTTCGLGYKECPGHFGHIRLASPVYHFGLIGTLVQILRCVCFHCSALMISKVTSCAISLLH